MAEYIEREALLEILNGLYDHHLMMCNYAADGATQDCIEAVIEAPTADVVEVVRCKDCKYFQEYTNEYKRNVENADGDCYLRVMYSDDYQFDAVKYCDYCSMGAKMDGKGEGE